MVENDVMRSKHLDGFFPYYIQWKRIIADFPLSPRDYACGRLGWPPQAYRSLSVYQASNMLPVVG